MDPNLSIALVGGKVVLRFQVPPHHSYALLSFPPNDLKNRSVVASGPAKGIVQYVTVPQIPDKANLLYRVALFPENLPSGGGSVQNQASPAS